MIHINFEKYEILINNITALYILNSTFNLKKQQDIIAVKISKIVISGGTKSSNHARI